MEIEILGKLEAIISSFEEYRQIKGNQVNYALNQSMTQYSQLKSMNDGFAADIRTYPLSLEEGFIRAMDQISDQRKFAASAEIELAELADKYWKYQRDAEAEMVKRRNDHALSISMRQEDIMKLISSHKKEEGVFRNERKNWNRVTQALIKKNALLEGKDKLGSRLMELVSKREDELRMKYSTFQGNKFVNSFYNQTLSLSNNILQLN